ncbi:discoidin domain-containing protein [Kitasatospora sp. NPDC048365]|uniref:galactose-binding domain-containing protein n=1 Tax=Kitasatospora sp. NPDC048365 TaxID=3364050 RepID=UPI00371C9D05
MRSKRLLPRLTATSVTVGMLLIAGPVLPARAAGGPNLAAGKAVTASSANGQYVVGNVNDGNQASYWESGNGALPQWVQVDLGSASSIDQVVLKLPTGWGNRTETLTVLGSTDGSNFTTVVGSAGYSFDQAGGNTVRINFPAATARYVRVQVSANTEWPAAQFSEFEVYGAAAASANLLKGRTLTASSANGAYTAGNVGDDNQASYWESSNSAFPQWVQGDLGSSVQVNRLVLKLPNGWGQRSQTLKVQGSTDGSAFTDLLASAAYSFDPAAGNQVTVSLPTSTTRYLRLLFTANSAWPAAQLSEFEAYGPVGGDTQAPTAPVNLAYTQPEPGKIRLTWGASADNVGVTGYDVYANGQLVTSVAGDVLTWTDSRPATETVTYTVRAKDAAGNQSNPSAPVTRTGEDPGDTVKPSAPGNLAYTEPAAGQIRLTWDAATDNIGVTGYDVYADGQLKASVAGTVRTWTDSQPASATVTYTVRAKDAAGNVSAASAPVTRTGNPGTPGSNLAAGKPIEASGQAWTFAPANANDGNLTTYWEGNSGAFPNTLTVKLGANADLQQVVVKLNPDPAWGARTQNIQVLGRADGATGFTGLKAAADYRFDPASGANTVSIPVTDRVSDLQLKFASNTGAPGGQVAELQVIGTPAPNPDLTVTDVSWSPASPNEATAITLRATVKNIGTLPSPADSVDFLLGGALADSVAVPALAAGESVTVSKNIGTRPQGSYLPSARVDADNSVRERNEDNNLLAAASAITVTQAPGPDLEVLDVTPNPASPAAGAPTSFSVQLRNRGIDPAPAGVTRLAVGTATLNTATPAIAAGQTVTLPVTGTWTAVSGGATITVTADATGTAQETNENNNVLSKPIVVGRGAAAPFTEYEAEDGTYQGELLQADATRTFGHTNFASESSGRKSVKLTGTGQYVEITSTVPTNSIVVRNSIPDAPGGGGIDATLSLYANGTFVQKLTLSSKHSWLYGTTDQPEGLTQTPQADGRRLFDEAHALLPQSFPVGTKLRLQRDAGDTAAFYTIDLIDLEQVAPPTAKPAECTSITDFGAVPNDGLDDTAAIQAAVTADQNGTISCVWIPAGQWRQEKKILTDDPLNRGMYNQVGIRDVTVRGAGMWHSQLYTLTEPHLATGSINHPHEGNFGFDIDDNTQISDIAIFGSGRIRGGADGSEGGVGLNGRFGKNTKINNVWIEHANVAVWVGRDYDNIPDLWNPADGLQFSGMRIRDTYADGINFSNGTRNSKVFNSTFRTTGDDAMAVWANKYVKNTSVDIGHDNSFTNNTVQLPWRATGIAVYGGYGNRIENNLVYDTANYPGIMLATDHDPLPFSGQTLIANNAIYRSGGAFWNEDQEFGALTLFAANQDIPGVVIRDTEIHDSTYDGIQFKTGGGTIPDVKITNVSIDKSNNGAGILAMSGARGSAVLTDVRVTNSAKGDIVRQPGTTFTITNG